jgi:hypothetical protein
MPMSSTGFLAYERIMTKLRRVLTLKLSQSDRAIAWPARALWKEKEIIESFYFDAVGEWRKI